MATRKTERTAAGDGRRRWKPGSLAGLACSRSRKASRRAMLPCRQERARASMPFCARHVGQGGREDLGRRRGKATGGKSREAPVPRQAHRGPVRRAIAGAAGDHLAAEDVRLPLEPPGQVPEDHPEEDAEAGQDDRRLHDLARIGELPGRDPGHRRIHATGTTAKPGDQRQDSQAAQEEEAEEGEMPVGDVAHLVAEDRRDLDGRQRLDQGVGEQDVAEPGQDPGHPGVDHQVSRVPDQDVGEAEPDPPGHALEPVGGADRPAGSGSATPGG